MKVGFSRDYTGEWERVKILPKSCIREVNIITEVRDRGDVKAC